MAGGAQGGGAKPAQGQGFNPQAAQQFQQALQNYRQGAMEMPSQMPGANAAAPGGGMPQFGMAKPMPMPAPGGGMAQTAVMPQFNPGQQGQQMSNLVPPNISVADPQMLPQGPISVGAYQPQISQPLPPAQAQPQPLPQAQPQPMPRPMPRPMPMPQVQGNPNAMPLQRPQPQGRPTMQMLRGRR